MKKLLSIILLSSVAISANAADESTVPATEANTTAAEVTVSDDCKAYYEAIEKLAEKIQQLVSSLKLLWLNQKHNGILMILQKSKRLRLTTVVSKLLSKSSQCFNLLK